MDGALPPSSCDQRLEPVAAHTVRAAIIAIVVAYRSDPSNRRTAVTQRSRLRDAEALLREKSALFKRSSGEKCCSAFPDFSGHGKGSERLTKLRKGAASQYWIIASWRSMIPDAPRCRHSSQIDIGLMRGAIHEPDQATASRVVLPKNVRFAVPVEVARTSDAPRCRHGSQID